MIKEIKRKLKYLLISEHRLHIRKFKKYFGYLPDTKNPKTLNEYLLWRSLYDRDPTLTHYADKYKVREFVDNSLLVPLIQVVDSPHEIDYETLPNQFIIKTNHGYAQNIIVYDKKNLDINKTNKQLKKWLKHSQYYESKEWQYKNIPPKIVIEELLLTSEGMIPDDIKFTCIGGKVVYIFWHIRSSSDHDRAGMYNRDLSIADFQKSEIKVPMPDKLEKPQNFEQMIEIAEELSKPFDLVRIDLYNVNGKIYFGEFTFTPANGTSRFEPVEYDYYYGKMILDLPNNSLKKYYRKEF